MADLAALAAKKKSGDAKELRDQLKMEEEKMLLKEKMDGAGLSFQNHELPDDELEQKDVAKTWWQSIKGVFPGTDEYYEGMAAEDEMDDLKAIRIEKAKASDLLAMTKGGNHEKALASMMSETNNDFFFFNKLMTKYREEGKWEFDEPELNPFGVLEAQQRKNRVRRAFRATYSLTTNDEAAALQGTLNAMNGANNTKNTSTTCNWKGKNKAGVAMKCTYDRFEHPHEMMKDPETRQQVPVLLDTCAYHSPSCVEEHDPGLGDIEIRVPNQYSMCTECHYSKKAGEAMNQGLKLETSPGVCPADGSAPAGAIPSDAELDAKNAAEDNKLNENSICEWKAGKKELHRRGFQCGNTVIRNPETKALQVLCGYHITKCLRLHTGGGNSDVKIPNKYGLCVAHHTAEYGEPPEEPDFPYPGMLIKRGKNDWKTAGHHWAAPAWAPMLPREAVEYEPPEPPEDFLQSIIAAGKYAKYMDKKRREGKRMATLIQSVWRRFKVHNTHKELMRQKKRRHRLESVVIMQCTARRRQGYNIVKGIRKKRNAAALLTQSHFRGFRARKRLRELWAGKRILAFFKRLRFLKFRDAVIVMMQLKKMSRRRHGNALELQRVYRGYKSRLLIFEARLWKWVQNRSSKVISRELRIYIDKKENFTDIEFVYPTMVWAKNQCGKRIAKLIWKLVLERKARFAFTQKLARVAIFVQRHVRGFIARKGARKMAYLHTVMAQWIKPQYAEEFTQRFFESNIFYMKDRKKKVVRPPTPPPEPTWLLRPLLPAAVKDDAEVNDETFYNVIARWYKEACVPMLQTEIDALKEEFANPASGRVVISELEDYIMLSSGPCRKHGRRICGKCAYRGKCSQKGCTCAEYHPSKEGKKSSICRDCFHAPDIHRRMPQQIKEADVPQTMLSLMRSKREPDTSMPASVTGMDFDDIIVPPENPDDVQMRRYNKADTTDLLATANLSDYRSSTLTLALMFLEEKGENIAKLDEYWGQTEVKIVGDMNTDLHGRPVGKGDKAIVSMPIYPVPPVTSLTQPQFWDNSAKNPLKSKRDYDEKFDHNMPMPITQDNDIVYTFEGSKVYLNLLVQIIDIGEGKVPGAKIGFDEPDFLRLITNHIQIFERHWRKMVADLRKGTLNRNAVVNKADRLMFEALSLPRIALSKTLDGAFRDLGFMTKGMGKDIKSSTYAERYRFAEVEPRARRPSLPMTAGGIGLDKRDLELRGRERLHGSVSRDVEFESSISKYEKDKAAKKRSMSPIHLPGSRGASRGGSRGGGSRGGSPIHGRASSPLGGSRVGTADSHGRPGTGGKLGLKNKSRRELLVMVGDSMKHATAGVDEQHSEERTRGPSRRVARDGRRGSDTDLVRDVNLNELHAMNTEQETAARTGYHFTIQTDGDRFICPFPACGKTFKSKDAAFRHLPLHEQRVRLYAPTALPDSHMQFYWPAAPPWEKHEIFHETVQPVGNFKCEWPGCKVSVADKEKLSNHMRMIHGDVGASSVTDNGHFKLQGQPLCVPPFKPPEQVAFAVNYCEIHLNSNGGCLKCVNIELMPGPQPPFRFFEGFHVDLSAKAEAAKVKYEKAQAAEKKGKKGKGKGRSPSPPKHKALDKADDGLHVLKVNNYDMEQAIIYRKMVGIVPSHHMAYACSVMTDKNNDAYIGCRPFLDYQKCIAHDVDIPRDFDKQNELLQLPGEEEEDFEWVPISQVQNACPIVYVSSKKKWKNLVKKKKIPASSYFIREEA